MSTEEEDAEKDLRLTYDVDVRIDVDEEKLVWPNADFGSLGRSNNFRFQSLCGITWDEAKETLEGEREILQECITAAGDENFEQRYDDLTFSDEARVLAGGLEIGVIGATLCLNAASCFTFYSCSGHDHGEGYPYVCFWVRPGSLPFLLEAAKEAGIGFISGRAGCGEVFSDRIDGLAEFASALLRRRTALEALPAVEVEYDVNDYDEDADNNEGGE